VVQGHATGEWRRTDTGSGRLLATETFDATGRLRQGRLRGTLMPGAVPVYHDQTRMGFAEPLPLINAENYALNPPCRPAVAPPLGGSSSGVSASYVPATYKNGPSAYIEMMLLRIRALLSQNTSLANYHGTLRFVVNLNATGGWQTEIYKAEGVNLEAARQILQVMRNLPRWEPAMVNGQAVACSVVVEFTNNGPSYRLSMKPQRDVVDTGFSSQSAR
jgi:hypothetical protein